MKSLNLTLSLVLSLAALSASAADSITKADIKAIISQTDAAAINKNTQGISEHLSQNFAKYIELPMEEWNSAFRIDKNKYLSMMQEDWENSKHYSYERTDTVIHVASDGLSASSNSTITKSLSIKGRKMVSKVRQYAQYELENGRPVITSLEGHKLVGDTTPDQVLFGKRAHNNN